MRKVFAIKPHLSFADFDSNELEHVKSMAWPKASSSSLTRSSVPMPSGSTSFTPKSHGPRPTVDRNRSSRSQQTQFKIKPTEGLPRNQTVCGGWNLDKCPDPPKCGRIHDICDVMGCYKPHKQINHPK
ncbi:uncharacterized protein MELLADRAFT_70290 [Melampsora larici-populina 98AG31]|uniref:Uncharacterized protein n=1 Tax=Melampsora larici-populina (strain 98AG31 / pathotype 3-4-7) TaxID=747676 RepID=F4SED2_MELLP|nr:uncharacterized protein MELLADRAFT_70290 [Melampsora larici-populina 98AG31]EGF96994.1 hypothetical protein MELLADRAFT_70290 [Melampsora larici-populina 98AG31]